MAVSQNSFLVVAVVSFIYIFFYTFDSPVLAQLDVEGTSGVRHLKITNVFLYCAPIHHYMHLDPSAFG